MVCERRETVRKQRVPKERLFFIEQAMVWKQTESTQKVSQMKSLLFTISESITPGYCVTRSPRSPLLPDPGEPWGEGDDPALDRPHPHQWSPHRLSAAVPNEWVSHEQPDLLIET